jgi:hypothetical protein
MATIEVSKPINTYQLSVALGGVGIRMVGPRPDGKSTISADVPQPMLDSVVGAHVADPAVVPPTPEPERTVETKVEEAHVILSEVATLPSPVTPADLADILARAAAALDGGA